MSKVSYLPLDNDEAVKKPRCVNVHSKYKYAFTVVVFGAAFAYLFWNLQHIRHLATVTEAKVVLSGDSTVKGTVTFTQDSLSSPVTIKGELSGLDASAARGFHIHQSGDLTNGCLSAGPHFNPYDKTHGAPTDDSRHVGDLGNIETDKDGNASFEYTDNLISLNGALSIIGRAVVVHAGTDDLGRGDDEESLKTGNVGGRAACGVIGLA